MSPTGLKHGSVNQYFMYSSVAHSLPNRSCNQLGLCYFLVGSSRGERKFHFPHCRNFKSCVVSIIYFSSLREANNCCSWAVMYDTIYGCMVGTTMIAWVLFITSYRTWKMTLKPGSSPLPSFSDHGSSHFSTLSVYHSWLSLLLLDTWTTKDLSSTPFRLAELLLMCCGNSLL